MVQEDGHVLVIGAAGVDIKATPYADELPAETSIAGRIRNSVGGVARNIGANLVKLEVPTVLLSVVGDDVTGERVLDESEASGIDVGEVLVVEGGRTGTWMGLMHRNGQLRYAISDYDIMDYMTPRYLYDRRHLFAEASLIVVDANLSDRVIETVFKLASRYELRVCADPTSADLAVKLCGYLDQLFMVVPNMREATALCGVEMQVGDRDSAQGAARRLVSLGAWIAVITLGDAGLVYATGDSSGYIPALHTDVIDSTGAGDALSAAVIFGILNGVPLDEAMRLGVSAAALTLRTPETVVPDLSLEMLYGELV